MNQPAPADLATLRTLRDQAERRLAGASLALSTASREQKAALKAYNAALLRYVEAMEGRNHA